MITDCHGVLGCRLLLWSGWLAFACSSDGASQESPPAGSVGGIDQVGSAADGGGSGDQGRSDAASAGNPASAGQSGASEAGNATGGTVAGVGGTAVGGDENVGGTNSGGSDSTGGTNTGTAGDRGDGGRPDTGDCPAAITLDGNDGPASATFDLREGPAPELVMGTGCAVSNQSGEGIPRYQTVVAYAVPGTGPQVVAFGTDNEETNAETGIEVRLEGCRQPPSGFMPHVLSGLGDFDPTPCFASRNVDDRVEGTVTAEGGTTIHFVVTLRSVNGTDNEVTLTGEDGLVRLDIDSRPAQLPTLSGAEFNILVDDVVLTFNGSDGDGDAAYFLLVFFDAAGAVIGAEETDPYRTITSWPDPYFFGFGTSPAGATDIDYENTIGSLGYADHPGLGYLLRKTQAAEVQLQLADVNFGFGNLLTVPIRYFGHVGEPCAEGSCTVGAECSGDVCVPTEEVLAACASATPVSLETPTEVVESVTLSGIVLPPGEGVIESSLPDCREARETPSSTSGQELVFDITVPEGRFDLGVTTRLAATEADTIIYLRRSCETPDSEFVCERYEPSFDPSVYIRDVAAGDYTIFVEEVGGAEADEDEVFDLNILLRPVLDSGSPCDDLGYQNRCDQMTCSDGLCP